MDSLCPTLSLYEEPKCCVIKLVVSLEDDAVADGGQQIVEVELVPVVSHIPAMLLPKLHQSFSKPAMWRRNGGERDDLPKPVQYTENKTQPVEEVLHLVQSHLYCLISQSLSDHQSHPGVLLQHLPQRNTQYDTPPLHNMVLERQVWRHQAGLKEEAGRRASANLI